MVEERRVAEEGIGKDVEENGIGGSLQGKVVAGNFVEGES